MAGIETTLVFALQDAMTGDPLTGFKDSDLFGIDLDLDRATPGTVEIAVDRHHAIFADASLDGDRSAVGDRRQDLQLLFGKGFCDDLRVVAWRLGLAI